MTGHVPGTTPYPWPYDGDLDPSRLALVVAGWDARWAAAVGHPAPVGAVVSALAADLGAHGVGVVAVAHGGSRPTGGPPPAPLPLTGAAAAHAAGINGFFGSSLDAHLRASGRTHLLLAGYGLEGPIHSTMRSANDRGYECLLVLDASAPVDPALSGAARSHIEMSGGIFGAVGTASDLRTALDHREDR